MVNEFRAGYTRTTAAVWWTAWTRVRSSQQDDVALFPFPVKGFPSIAFNFSGEGTGSTTVRGCGGGASDLNYENRFQFVRFRFGERGKHSMKIGGDLRRNRYDNLRGNPFFGQFIFGSIFSSSTDTPGSGGPLPTT